MKHGSVPVISPGLHRWFQWYARRYIERHFNSIRLLRDAPPPSGTGGACVFFLNHASWWDPLVALFLAGRFQPGQQAFGPIDEAALGHYGFLRKLGFFPVERGTIRGTRQFLSYAKAILGRPGNSLWLTPQGKFSDIRERPPRFEAGLGYLAAKMPEIPMVPVAIEFIWWFERSPEILVAFGNPVSGPDARCEQALATIQDRLAAASRSRDPAAFEILLSGKTGVGGIYDMWRRWRARLKGEKFVPDHHLPDRS